MIKNVAELYNQSPILEETKRLKSFQYPDRVSIIEMGNINGVSVIDVGAGPNRNLEEFVDSKGGKYTALDISMGFLKNRKDNVTSSVAIQANAKNLPFDVGQDNKRVVHERFLLMNLGNEDRKTAVREALRVAGNKGGCLFIDYDWSDFKGEGVMEEFGSLTRELLIKMGVDINFGSRSRQFIENELTQLDMKAKVRSTKYERLNEGDYNEVEGILKSLSSISQKIGDEDFKNRWEDMKNKLNLVLDKSEGQKSPYTPPTIVSVYVESV